MKCCTHSQILVPISPLFFCVLASTDDVSGWQSWLAGTSRTSAEMPIHRAAFFTVPLYLDPSAIAVLRLLAP